MRDKVEFGTRFFVKVKRRFRGAVFQIFPSNFTFDKLFLNIFEEKNVKNVFKNIGEIVEVVLQKFCGKFGKILGKACLIFLEIVKNFSR